MILKRVKDLERRIARRGEKISEDEAVEGGKLFIRYVDPTEEGPLTEEEHTHLMDFLDRVERQRKR